VIEQIFNLFLIGNEDQILQIGCKPHWLSGSDEQKRDFLLARVDEDFQHVEKMPLKKPISWEHNYGQQRLVNDISLFEPFFKKYAARPDPFSVRTAVVNGKIKIDGVHGGSSPLPFDDGGADNELLGQEPFDYLKTYIKNGSFDVMQLLYDDHFEAIKLLFNQGKTVSCLKLLMIFIDTMGFLEAGYNRGSKNFITWLDKYVDLSSVGITALELWEFRNGILHMTNTEADKNRAGHLDRLVPRISSKAHSPTPGFKPFEILGLIQAIGAGVGNWAQSLNDQRHEFPQFVARYDTLMSDRRRLYFEIKD